MRNHSKDNFGSYNPHLILAFYFLVILGTVLLSHPAITVGSFGSGLLYVFYLRGRRAVKLLAFVVPVMILGSLLNPLFNHRGANILTYFRGNPITAEAIAYGIASAFMLGAIIFWFATFNDVITSEKLMHVFGRFAPALTLIFSMVLRFVPRFGRQMKSVAQGQKAVGRDVASGNLKQKIGHGLKIMSIMTTWSLENSVDLADSMKARGYGSGKRSHFAIYRMEGRDVILAIVMLLGLALITILAAGLLGSQGNMNFYPRLYIERPSATGVVFNLLLVLFFLTPMILNVYEDLKWKRLISEI